MGVRASRARWMRGGGLAVAATLATIVAGTPAVSAQPGSDHHQAFSKADLGSQSLHFTPASQSNRMVSVMLQMQGQPVAVHEATAQGHGNKLSNQAKQAIHDQLKAAQD